MVSKKSNSKRGLGIASIFLAVLIIVSALGYFAYANSTSRSLSDDHSIVPKSELVTIKGTALCLPHKDTTGPQTMECAYGLKDESGIYYALSDSDPGYKNISSLPMNDKVEATGTLKKQTNTTYPTVGTITVTKISQVQ
jgi:hypothetical protein